MPNFGDDAGAGHRVAITDAQPIQLATDERRGAVLLEPQLRVSMQPPGGGGEGSERCKEAGSRGCCGDGGGAAERRLPGVGKSGFPKLKLTGALPGGIQYRLGPAPGPGKLSLPETAARDSRRAA
jgi:hypothetical protein